MIILLLAILTTPAQAQYSEGLQAGVLASADFLKPKDCHSKLMDTIKAGFTSSASQLKSKEPETKSKSLE